MDAESIGKLSRAVDKKVRITTVEGETFVAKVIWVDHQNGELVHELITTSQPDRYHRMNKANPEGAYLIPFDYISRVDFAEDSHT